MLLTVLWGGCPSCSTRCSSIVNALPHMPAMERKQFIVKGLEGEDDRSWIHSSEWLRKQSQTRDSNPLHKVRWPISVSKCQFWGNFVYQNDFYPVSLVCIKSETEERPRIGHYREYPHRDMLETKKMSGKGPFSIENSLLPFLLLLAFFAVCLAGLLGNLNSWEYRYKTRDNALKLDFKKLSLEEAHVWGIGSLTSSSRV